MIDWCLYWVVKSLGWVLCRIPPHVAVACGMAVGHVASWCQPTRVRIGECNLKAAFGDRLSPTERRRIIQRMFRYLVAGVVEMLRLPVIDAAYAKRFIQMEGYHHFERAVQSGRPVVLMTAHFGNWELGSVTTALLGHPVVVLARAQEKFPRLYRLLISSRESKGCRVVHKGGAMRHWIRALKCGEPVAIAGDQASRTGLAVNFFGRPAWFATGPFELAARYGATIVPAFLYRVRGPYHRAVVEPPLDLSAVPSGTGQAGLPQGAPSGDVVRAGIEQFAAILAGCIERDPAQWLWVHNRWKHTPTRHVLVLSDGKHGHVKQSLTVVRAIRAACADVRDQVIEIRYRHRLARLLTLLWAWWVPGGIGGMRCLRWTLTREGFTRLVNASADVVISCGASIAPVNLLVTAENRARSVVIMNPSPLPLRRFSLAFVPLHDRVARQPHVVQIPGALHAITDEELATSGERLLRHPQFRGGSSLNGPQPAVSVLLGGDTREYALTTAFVDALIRQVLDACEAVDGSCLVTTSRRTPPDVERLLQERLDRHPRCRLLLLAGRHQLNPAGATPPHGVVGLHGTAEGMLGLAQVVVVTGESISMVTEACASGRHVLVIDPPLRQAGWGRLTKPQRYVRQLAEQGYAKPLFVLELGRAIQRVITQPSPQRRLEASAAIHAAVKRVL